MASIKHGIKRRGPSIGNFPKGRFGSTTKGLYGGRKNGKKILNGGFNNSPVSSLSSIDDNEYIRIFGLKSQPEWRQKLYATKEE